MYHRDYFDLGEMVYEQIPVFGKIIKTMKSRMAKY
ncbi:MAG: transcriptional regulator [Bacteroidetes bacterium]|nr:transcriptional regulator [Bacteroidota bacterium]